MTAGIPVTQFLQCVASWDIGLAMRWLGLSGGSPGEVTSVSTLLFCVFSMLCCLPSSQKAGQEVGMGPSALLGLSSPPSVHVAHCLFILCSGRRSPKWENYKQYQHVGPEAPKATILRSKVIFEKGFLLHHAWAEGITRGEQVSNCKVFSPPTL